jgi:wobble nucleotide-excising tRNase
MKITRIQRIRGHRIYKEFSWPNTLPDFARFNVIYGLNGAGKTTLSNLFRHLETKQSILEGEVHFVIDDRVVNHAELTTAQLPAVSVFNRDSVDRTIFELPGKHLSPIYFLGENSIEKQKAIEALKSDVNKARQEHVRWGQKKSTVENERDTYCSAEAKAIKNLLTISGGGPYNTYDSRAFKQGISNVAQSTDLQLLTEEETVRFLSAKDAKIKERIAFVGESFPDLIKTSTKVQQLLSRSVVSTVIDELVQNPSLAGWINEGLKFHSKENENCICRFCEQSLPVNRHEKLKSHFNDEFKKFIDELQLQIEDVKKIQDKIDALHLPEKSLFYEHLLPRYDKTLSLISQQRASIKLYLDSLMKALRTKKDNPFQIFELQSFFSWLNSDSEAGWLLKLLDFVGSGTITIAAMQGYAAVQQLDALINEHNSHTENFQQTVASARAALERSHLISALPKYKELCTAIEDAQTKSQEASENIRCLNQQIVDLEREIKQHQRPAEQLNAEMCSYLGRSELKFEVKDAGYLITRNGKPALHLSEGERTAIAFMYFLKCLEDSSFDIKTGIIVIDDPISSLDANSMYSAFGFLKERTKEAGQLFILTHNFTFFRQIRNWFNKIPGQQKSNILLHPARFYMLASRIHNGERCASIESLDPLLHRFESEYHYLFKRIYDEANRTGPVSMEENYSIPNIARRVLESFLAFRLPGNPGELHQQLEQVAFDVAKKTRILRFLHTHSHYGHIAEPEHDLSILAEAQPILQDLLTLMRDVDHGHYSGMVALVERVAKPKAGAEDAKAA